MGLVNSSRYTRMYDFRRDSWKQLIDKKYSKSWNTPERLPYLNTINEILEERIKNNGRHYLEQVSEYENLKKLKLKESKKNLVEKKDFISLGDKKVPLTKNGLPNKTFLSLVEKEILDSFLSKKEEKSKPEPIDMSFDSLEDLRTFIKNNP